MARKAGGICRPGNKCISGSIDGDTQAVVRTASAEVSGVGNRGIDYKFTAPVIGAKREAYFTRTSDNKARVDCFADAFFFLVCDWLMQLYGTRSRGENQ